MTIIQKLSHIFKNVLKTSNFSKKTGLVLLNQNLFVVFSLIIFFSILFFSAVSIVQNKNIKNQENLKKISKSSEFSNLTSYFFSKINSPYIEKKYLIQNNDSIEKILKKFEVDIQEIKKITTRLKQKKLSNIYSGRELNLILKKDENGSLKVVHIKYPIIDHKYHA